jgi:catechol 2,3-dioxygenase-like lactoylglutathione lyase family enzyme
MIHHVSLGSNDVKRARAFYDPLMSLIGLRLLEHSERSLHYGASDIIFSIETPTSGSWSTPARRRRPMGIAKYEILGTEGTWRVRHDGKAENEYATKEAAFEAAIAAASIALREGHDVTVTAPSSQTTTGAPGR